MTNICVAVSAANMVQAQEIIDHLWERWPDIECTVRRASSLPPRIEQVKHLEPAWVPVEPVIPQETATKVEPQLTAAPEPTFQAPPREVGEDIFHPQVPGLRKETADYIGRPGHIGTSGKDQKKFEVTLLLILALDRMKGGGLITQSELKAFAIGKQPYSPNMLSIAVRKFWKLGWLDAYSGDGAELPRGSSDSDLVIRKFRVTTTCRRGGEEALNQARAMDIRTRVVKGRAEKGEADADKESDSSQTMPLKKKREYRKREGQVSLNTVIRTVAAKNDGHITLGQAFEASKEAGSCAKSVSGVRRNLAEMVSEGIFGRGLGRGRDTAYYLTPKGYDAANSKLPLVRRTDNGSLEVGTGNLRGDLMTGTLLSS